MTRRANAILPLVLCASLTSFAQECTEEHGRLLAELDAARERSGAELPLHERLADWPALIERAAGAQAPLFLRTACRALLEEVEDPGITPWSEHLAPCPSEILAGETPLDGPLEVLPFPERPAGAEGPVPIVRYSGDWPRRALRSGLQGRVSLTFTIDEAGKVRDVRVLDSTHRMFERPAREALARFLYVPMQVDGEAMALERVPHVVRFDRDPRALRDLRRACASAARDP